MLLLLVLIPPVEGQDLFNFFCCLLVEVVRQHALRDALLEVRAFRPDFCEAARTHKLHYLVPVLAIFEQTLDESFVLPIIPIPLSVFSCFYLVVFKLGSDTIC